MLGLRIKNNFILHLVATHLPNLDFVILPPSLRLIPSPNSAVQGSNLSVRFKMVTVYMPLLLCIWGDLFATKNLRTPTQRSKEC